jgi:hypothetical protein
VIVVDDHRVAYEYPSRGEGFAEYAAEGPDIRIALIDLIGRTPEPILRAADLAALNRFLRNVPDRDDRRTVSQRAEGARLIQLLQGSNSHGLIPEARDVLCAWLSGKSLRPRGRPKKHRSTSNNADKCRVWGSWIKQHVEELLRQKAPLDVPRWGAVDDNATWADLSVSDHAMLIAHKALQDRGFSPPSIRTLRNNLINYPLRDLFVKDKPSDE